MAPPLLRLNNHTLARVNGGVQLPSYDRKSLSSGMVHLGLGNFARAHLASYVEDVLEAGDSRSGVIGVSLQRPDQRDRLAPQDGLYTALQRDGTEVRPRIIGCLKQVLVAPEDPAAVVRVLADQTCRIVSLTVTEKGYCFDAGSGQLDFNHPVIRADLQTPHRPRSVFGFLAAALRARLDAGNPPFTILCCDNLADNGRLLSSLLEAFVRHQDAELADWIVKNVAFPSTMVDRIVPETSEADFGAVSRVTGLVDLAPVSHEPFRQWVIEDRLAGDIRGTFERAGAQIAADVSAFERLKLRILNGAHSALAYLGCVVGHSTIREAVADPIFRRFIGDLWEREIIPAVRPPPGINPSQYVEAVLRRFDNPAIEHKTSQVAADGSQKLPVRLLAVTRERLQCGGEIPRLAHVVAAWIRYLEGLDERGRRIEVRDPLNETLQIALTMAGNTADAKVAAVLDVNQIFGAELANIARFRNSVLYAYKSIVSRGILDATAAIAAAPSNY